MEYIIVGITAFIISGLTLYSGFGLGTVLLPVFALFFPIEIAIAMTAVVHLLNNLFKLVLLGKHADKSVVMKFGLPAILAAFAGAWLLLWFSGQEAFFRYTLFQREMLVTPVKLVIAVLMAIFALLELLPNLNKMSFSQKLLPVGGVLSGFFGGLSGHQGALRSAFLLRAGLTKETFIATGVVISCLVDFSRLFIYGSRFGRALSVQTIDLLLVAVVAAFLGVFLANRYLHKVTMRAVQIIVSVLLFAIALGLGSGLI
jgi:hypothetical protein